MCRQLRGWRGDRRRRAPGYNDSLIAPRITASAYFDDTAQNLYDVTKNA
jgi:hypothetical protein